MRSSALLCLFALLCVGCGPDVDLTKALQVEIVSDIQTQSRLQPKSLHGDIELKT